MLINDERKHDTLVVWKPDRLGCTAKGLIKLVNQLNEKGSHFKSITDNIDTSTTCVNMYIRA